MKLRILTTCLMLLSAIGLYSCEEEKNIAFDKLPQTAQQFVEQHFSSQKVVRIVQDKDDGRKDYEVIFENGTTIDFNESGAWTHIESTFTPLPVSFLPASLQTDLAQRYPDASVHEIDLELGGYEIELGNRRTLYYTTDGTFVREVPSEID